MSSSAERKRKAEDADRAAKLAKKVSEHLKKHGSHTASGYRDTDNPFNDEKISERFVWGKKIEKDVLGGKSIKEYSAAAHSKRDQERQEEIEKVRRRREEREAERMAIAEELDMVQRERARAEAVELERQEDLFHLEQAKIRAQQRLGAGRPKAIDVITINLFVLDGFEMTAEEEPAEFVCALPLDQLEELREDIVEYRRLDAVNRDHNDFWAALDRVSRHATQAAKQKVLKERDEGWHPSLEADIAAMLGGKSLQELEVLEAGVRQQVNSGEAPDPDFYHAILQRLDVYKAKAVLKEFHVRVVGTELERVKRGERVIGKAEEWEEEDVKREEEDVKVEEVKVEEAGADGIDGTNPEEIKLEDDTDDEEEREGVPEEEGVPDAAAPEVDTAAGGVSGAASIGPSIGPAGPPPGGIGPAGPPSSFTDALQRKAMDGAHGGSDSLMRHIVTTSRQTDEERKLQAMASAAMGRDASEEADLLAEFGGEVEVTDTRPGHVVKPKYFNKIHQRFHWTKYNKAHYDKDSPPPKVVSGYKFNIFYPDLVGAECPSYKFEKDPTSTKENPRCIIRFSAPKPYQDVAFRIIDKPWNERRTRIVFDRGILQVYFQFRQKFYKK